METGIRELRNHLSKYLAAVRSGEEIVVTDHGKAFARLIPLDRPRPIDRLIAEGVVTPAAVARQRLEAAAVAGTAPVSDLVAVQRR
ncbi:type II toxin-antitoxin system Phd/YefM family antitoxin [Candidatus Poriferisodalis sp.]|uniref:type II toxin-antitoxin system Phd/YefM family antitoxin n=1 Tax=Candidatus Poriferisodalis sp. TaxID=3101277 RepID=UPI003AF9D8FD